MSGHSTGSEVVGRDEKMRIVGSAACSGNVGSVAGQLTGAMPSNIF